MTESFVSFLLDGLTVRRQAIAIPDEPPESTTPGAVTLIHPVSVRLNAIRWGLEGAAAEELAALTAAELGRIQRQAREHERRTGRPVDGAVVAEMIHETIEVAL